ncbi:MAG TPA: DEAD/DEAH box helicase [Devosia sp.]|jgi:superfamily II DNA or RNA helicase|nr:DEAD/DEAH box helicase [Devosia sp.]
MQELLGDGTLKLVHLLAEGTAGPSVVRDLLLRLKPPTRLLSDKKSRAVLINLLRPDEALELCRLLGLRSGDPYDALKTASYGRDRLERLIAFFGLPLPPPDDDTPASPVTTVTPAHPLFAHQLRAAMEVRRMLQHEPRRVLLHMPTGSGKTRTAMHVIADELRTKLKTLVVWLAHSEELCDQATEEFGSVWSHVGNRAVQVHRLFGTNKFAARDAVDGLVVAGFSKLYQRALSDPAFVGLLGARSSLVVVDEAHQAIAPTYQMILEVLTKPFPQVGLLGLSATPGRTWNDVAKDEQLSCFFARQKVSLRVDGYSNPVDYLVAEGYLARLNFSRLPFDWTGALEPDEVAAIEKGFEIPGSVLKRLADDDQRSLAILRRCEALLQYHMRVIVFATTVEHAELLASALCLRGHQATAVTAQTDLGERRRILADFKSHDSSPRILCNFGVLTTGFDAPRTSAALIARPTRSLVLYSQMVGRAARGPRAGGNEQADIVAVVDTGLPGFGDMGSAFTNWEDVWD